MNLDQKTKDTIRDSFNQIQSVAEFAALLNFVYEKIYQTNKYQNEVKITQSLLNFYAFIKKDCYTTFEIKKKAGGRRIINTPKYKLKTIQRCLNEIFKTLFIPHFAAAGFIEGRNIVTNANMHIRKKYVYNIDLQDFFTSIDFRRIKTILEFEPFNLKNVSIAATGVMPATNNRSREELGYMIANLCCKDGVLPQGAPTSPIITNMICTRLDKKLFSLAKLNKARYTRYADDITFSSNKEVFNHHFKGRLEQIIEKEEHLKINDKKERLQCSKERQIVTGIVVNVKLNISREYNKDLRFWLMCAAKFGIDQAQSRFDDKNQTENVELRKVNVIRYISGKIRYFQMVKGISDPTAIRYLMKFDQLVREENEKRKLYNFVDIDVSLEKMNDILHIWRNNGIVQAIESVNL